MNRTRPIQLPPLSLDAAVACLDVLECVIDAIWSIHGDDIYLWRDMVRDLRREVVHRDLERDVVHRDAPPSPPPIPAAPSDDDDLPF